MHDTVSQAWLGHTVVLTAGTKQLTKEIAMNAVLDTITAIETATTTQDEHGQFDGGSKDQQAAAEIAEMYLNNFNLIHNHADNVVEDATIAAVLTGMRDLQVRDYVLGLVTDKNRQQYIDALTEVAKHAPENKYSDAPITVAAAFIYEGEDAELADTYLANVSENYALAQLLRRVFKAGWHANQFAKMRNEVHASVKAGIFGEDK